MDYKFSIIIAVNSSSEYLADAVDSVIAQNIGFGCVQLILVAACSHEGVGALCDGYAKAYPDNVKLIRINTKDQSTARNLGLRHARGEYVNFLDADDRLSPETLSRVYAFFRAHPEEVDLVSIPIRFFDGLTGEQSLNGKFEQGTRVIDLEREWEVTQISMASAFAPLACFEELFFEPCLGNAAEAQLAHLLLARRLRLGVVAEAEYGFRRPSERKRTALHMKARGGVRYLSYVEKYPAYVMQWCWEHHGRVPRSVQYGLLYHMQWRWAEKTRPASALTPEEGDRYVREMSEVLGAIDEDLIQDLRTFSPIQKNVIFQLRDPDKPRIAYWLDFAHWQEDGVLLEGRIVPAAGYVDSLSLDIRVNEECFPCRLDLCHRWVRLLGTDAGGYMAFRVLVPYPSRGKRLEIAFRACLGEREVELVSFGYGKFFPVGRKYQNAYCIRRGYILTCGDSTLQLQPARWGERWVREYRFLREIWKTNAHSDRKAIAVRLAFPLRKFLKIRPLWLISDRITKAGDNGEALFRYLREKERWIDSRFILSGSSPDVARMKQIGPVVKFRSRRHNILTPLAAVVVSSHMEENIYRPYEGLGEPYRDLYADVKFVFLQHGITKDDISVLINRYKKNYSGVVAAAVPEYRAFLQGGYGYDENQIMLTGFPRFDRLYHAEQKKIVIMPTWRRYLMDTVREDTGEWTLAPEFAGSEYVRFYSRLLTSEKLLSAAKALGYRLAFCPHPSVQPHLHLFTIDASVELLGPETEYRDIFAQSDLLVTDYSSVVFDFAYLRKPVVYTHFDAGTFFGGNHTYTKGYFDYERDGFGEVETDLDGTVERIIEYMESGCRLKPCYRERIDGFFAFGDRENCRRVVRRIREITGRE